MSKERRMSMDKRTQLVELMKKYVDEQGSIDITKFRLENPTEYALLPHYFGGVNSAVEQCGWVKVVKTKCQQGTRARLRDQLAYYALRELRKKHTLDQIGEQFGGVTRAAVNQLYKVLEHEITADKLNKKKQNRA